ncbi:NAD(P)-binding protein [Stipitochalara longipes BDJ]|nr:NAD(P)-binding protein [Stipitochalara longipes BDJ]
MTSAQSILIIGATRGIGLELVRQALSAHPSATVYATARDEKAATELHNLAKKSDGRVKIVSADANNINSLKIVAAEIKKSFSALDTVIYNAGVLNGFGNILEVGIDGLKKNIDTNVYGAYYAAVEFAPLLLKSTYPKKSLVLLSSEYGSIALSSKVFTDHEKLFGVTGYDSTAMYNISKTALNRLGTELDHVLRPQGLPVLLVHPGLVKTDMNPFGDIDVAESAVGIINVIRSFSSTTDKNFVGWNGQELPW